MIMSMMIFLLVDTVSVEIILVSFVRSLMKILIQPVKIIYGYAKERGIKEVVCDYEMTRQEENHSK